MSHQQKKGRPGAIGGCPSKRNHPHRNQDGEESIEVFFYIYLLLYYLCHCVLVKLSSVFGRVFIQKYYKNQNKIKSIL